MIFLMRKLLLRLWGGSDCVVNSASGSDGHLHRWSSCSLSSGFA